MNGQQEFTQTIPALRVISWVGKIICGVGINTELGMNGFDY